MKKNPMKNGTTNSTSSDVTNGSTVNSNEVSTGEVEVAIPLHIQSVITQVDRSGQPTKISSPHPTSESNSVDTSSEYKILNPSRFSVFRRIFCCQPKSDSILSQQPQSQNNIIISAPNRPVTPQKGRQPQNGSIANNIPRNPPLRMPNMPKDEKYFGRKCLALDLDETLVHSSFQPVDQASFLISVTIEDTVHSVYVIKRPGVDEFMSRMAKYYELVIYTASLSKYADPLLDLLDIDKLISKRLFRENCVFHDGIHSNSISMKPPDYCFYLLGHYVKDLSILNRDIAQTIIVDNSPMSYIFHPENAIDCGSFFDDPMDVELWQIADFLEHINNCEDVRPLCRHWREWCRNNPSSVPPMDGAEYV